MNYDEVTKYLDETEEISESTRIMFHRLLKRAIILESIAAEHRYLTEAIEELNNAESTVREKREYLSISIFHSNHLFDLLKLNITPEEWRARMYE